MITVETIPAICTAFQFTVPVTSPFTANVGDWGVIDARGVLKVYTDAEYQSSFRPVPAS